MDFKKYIYIGLAIAILLELVLMADVLNSVKLNGDFGVNLSPSTYQQLSLIGGWLIVGCIVAAVISRSYWLVCAIGAACLIGGALFTPLLPAGQASYYSLVGILTMLAGPVHSAALLLARFGLTYVEGRWV